MPPQAEWYQGKNAISDFLVAGPLAVAWRLVPIIANGQSAFGCYTPDGSGWSAHSVDVLTLRADRIAHLTAFLQPALLRRFSLPQRVAARDLPAPAAADNPSGPP